jgi:tetratricopeptide (TPR) repeat protein
MLEKVVAEAPQWWNAQWFYGKSQLALGNHEAAYEALRNAYNLERNVEVIPRELAGVCLELRRFNEAVAVAEEALALDPTTQNCSATCHCRICWLDESSMQEERLTRRSGLPQMTASIRLFHAFCPRSPKVSLLPAQTAMKIASPNRRKKTNHEATAHRHSGQFGNEPGVSTVTARARKCAGVGCRH